VSTGVGTRLKRNPAFQLTYAVILGACLLFLPAPALADDAAPGRAGSSVMPVYDSQIRMVHEAVTLDLRLNPVDAVFTFQNLGRDTMRS